MRNILLFRRLWLQSILLLLPALGFAQVTQEWVARYNGPGNSFDAARSVAADASGNVYVTGTSAGRYATIKYNSAGVQLWIAIYDGPGIGNDEANALALDALGNVYVTGRSAGIGTGTDYTTIKYNAAGVQQWEARYNGAGTGLDEATALALDALGNVYVTGSSTGISTGSSDYATIKYNANGVQQWAARYNGPGNGSDNTTALAVDASGNVYVTGGSGGAVGTPDFNAFDYDTIKYNTNGLQQWVARYNGSGNNFDFARSLAIDASGNVYVTGGSAGSGTNRDYATIKYDTDGNTTWVKRFNGSGNFNDDANDIAVDDQGNVYVTGESNREPFINPDEATSSEFATIRYDASGNELWVATNNGPFVGGIDVARAIAVDASGNAYVTGESATGDSPEGQTFEDYATIKYNTNGLEQWEIRYNGAGDFEDDPIDLPAALAIDTLGNVYVTGLSRGDSTGYDYATIKYSQLSFACGKKGNKVLVCHKGKKTLCISEADAAGHINHVDQLGECIVDAAKVAANESELSVPGNALPDRLHIFNAPNPAYTTTYIYYELPAEGHVTIKVFDLFGKEITTLLNAIRKAGIHSSEFDVSALQKGFYFYRITLKTKDKVWVQTWKICVLK